MAQHLHDMWAKLLGQRKVFMYMVTFFVMVGVYCFCTPKDNVAWTTLVEASKWLFGLVILGNGVEHFTDKGKKPEEIKPVTQ